MTVSLIAFRRRPIDATTRSMTERLEVCSSFVPVTNLFYCFDGPLIVNRRSPEHGWQQQYSHHPYLG